MTFVNQNAYIPYSLAWDIFCSRRQSMVSCQKSPIRHAYAWLIVPFWQDTLAVYLISSQVRSNMSSHTGKKCILSQVHAQMLKITNVEWHHVTISNLWGITNNFSNLESMVSCQKGPTRHAYAWQIGPFGRIPSVIVVSFCCDSAVDYWLQILWFSFV